MKMLNQHNNVISLFIVYERGINLSRMFIYHQQLIFLPRNSLFVFFYPFFYLLFSKIIIIQTR